MGKPERIDIKKEERQVVVFPRVGWAEGSRLQVVKVLMETSRRVDCRLSPTVSEVVWFGYIS
jgi:hypothetical protein